MTTLAAYLSEHRITQEAFAEKVGTTQETVSKWVRGRMPRTHYLPKIEAATGGAVTANDFVAVAVSADDRPTTTGRRIAARRREESAVRRFGGVRRVS